ncbi:MAG: hypothetical protein J6J60_03320 [Clostridia bacterium]|nr:hypothetical protein [Clostridia bacterium]
MDNGMIEKDKKEIKKISFSIREVIFDFLVVICLVMFSIILSPKELQNDTFYTIKCGEYIFQNGIFNLTMDPFSWLDLPYNWPHWLYDLIIYIIYAKSGLDGIYISTIIFTAILGICTYNTSKYVSKNRVVSSIVTFLSMYLISPYIAARAQLVTFILFTLEIYFIEKFLDSRKIRYGVYLILIAALIAQLHVAVFPMFFIFTLPYIAEFIFALFCDSNLDGKFFKCILKLLIKFSKNEETKKKFTARINKINQNMNIRKVKIEKNRENPYKVKVVKNKAVLYLVIIILIAALTGLLNPTGKTAYTYLYTTYIGNTTDSINEHQPVTLFDSTNFAIALIIFLVILTFMDSKIRLKDLFMLTGVIILAFMSRRQIAIFAIAGTPILVKLISEFFEKYDKKTCDKLLKMATSIIGFCLIIICFGFFVKETYIEKAEEEYIYASEYPVDAVNWIKQNLDISDLKIYNEYNYGSYLIYQDIPVFIDSRADLYAPEFNNKKGYLHANYDVFTDALDIPSLSTGYEEVFEKYGVNHVMLYANAKMCLLLDEDENYNLLYDDDEFRVYERLNVNNGN